jgi:4-amino-4-deoxy-L-arabinose transferase-like glycosyltransferase
MKRLTFYLLSLFILIGTILRVYRFDFQGLLCDEAYTLMVSSTPFIEILKFTLFNDCNPPLYYLLAHVSYILMGFADVAIRVPSIIIGILTIPAMYYLGAAFRYNTKSSDIEHVGLIAAAITTILFPLVYYSQFARSYALLILAFTVFFTIFIYIRRTTNNINQELNAPIEDYFLLGVVGGLCVWIHLFAIIPVAATIMTFFVTSSKRNAIRAALTAILVMAPLLPLFWVTRTQRALQNLTWGMDMQTLSTYLPFEFFGIACIVFIPLILVTIYRGRSDNVTNELAIIGFVTVGLGLVASFVTPVFPRYFFPLYPIFIVFTSVAIMFIASKMKHDWQKIAVVGVVLGSIIFLQYHAYIVHYFTYRLIC